MYIYQCTSSTDVFTCFTDISSILIFEQKSHRETLIITSTKHKVPILTTLT